MYYFPRHIWRNIFQYDSTWRKKYDEVMNEIKLRYNDGLWWIKSTGIVTYGSRKYYSNNGSNNFSKRELIELNFLDRVSDYKITNQYFNYRDLINQFKYKL